MRRVMSAGLAAGLSLAAAGSALAKEAGDQYPNGAEGFMAGALPPSGNYFINYAGYYSGDLHDNSGDKVNGVSVAAWFDALRYVRVTNTKLFGADYGWHVIVPVVNQTIETPGGDGDNTGLGDITINPVILGWHRPNLHVVAGLDIHLPTGAYDKNKPLENIGANYTSYEPLLAVTYLSQGGWEASGKFMYNIKTENTDTDYRSGNEFHMDYTLAKHDGKWAYGLGGYYLSQLEDDEVNGASVADTRGTVLAIGPQVKYDHAGMSFILKWQRETMVENRFGGDKVYFKFVTGF